jgi:two-component system, cell cycle response regulator DivK
MNWTELLYFLPAGTYWKFARSGEMSKRALVVEDDLLNRMLYCAVLEGRDFTVEAVADGGQVMTKVKEFAPDLIIMDINLPNVSGLRLIETLQADKKFRQIPILAVTAYVGKGEENRIRKAGARDYLAKPIKIEPFMAAVNKLLSGEEAKEREA